MILIKITLAIVIVIAIAIVIVIVIVENARNDSYKTNLEYVIVSRYVLIHYIVKNLKVICN